jgi:hypothetical protein
MSVTEPRGDRRLSPRQVTIMVVALCVAVVLAPVAAVAATAAFSSGSASTPAVSAKNTSSGTGAKAVYGNASASGGINYGIYGRTASAQGYGVYSAGRLGTSGALVCSHCVTGGDLKVASLPPLPDADHLGGHAASYYAHVVPLSYSATELGDHLVVAVDGLAIHVDCELQSVIPIESLRMAASSDGADGTLNWFSVTAGGTASASGTPLTTTMQSVATSTSGAQVEGTAIYRNNASGQIITVDFHLYAATCELFGDVLTSG